MTLLTCFSPRILFLFVCSIFVQSLYSQVGKVGINTTTPSAMLTVKDSSVVFLGPNPLPGAPGNPPVNNTGTRMMWYSDKAAFRVGRVTNNGWLKDSIGNYSIAGGLSCQAKGSSSLSLGSLNTANGTGSVALGGGNKASDDYSFAAGLNTVSSGYASFSMGNATRATSDYSVAFGSSTKASGNASFAIGDQTTARPYASFVAGRFNDTTSLSSITWDSNDPLFVLGNGINNNTRANALTILKNGRTGINTASPDALLHIVRNGASGGGYDGNSVVILESNENSYIQFSQTSNKECGFLSGNATLNIRSALVFAADSAVHIRSGGNVNRISVNKLGNVGIGTTPSFQLHLSSDSAGKPTSNTWTVASDARLKKDIHTYEDGLEAILKIKPVWFTYTGEANLPRETGVGVLAQELHEIAPYMVGTWNAKDENGKETSYLSVNNGAMTYMLINAVKEQELTIKNQQTQIDFLMNELKTLKERIGN
jgi:hypothetical protein